MHTHSCRDCDGKTPTRKTAISQLFPYGRGAGLKAVPGIQGCKFHSTCSLKARISRRKCFQIASKINSCVEVCWAPRTLSQDVPTTLPGRS